MNACEILAINDASCVLCVSVMCEILAINLFRINYTDTSLFIVLGKLTCYTLIWKNDTLLPNLQNN